MLINHYYVSEVLNTSLSVNHGQEIKWKSMTMYEAYFRECIRPKWLCHMPYWELFPQIGAAPPVEDKSCTPDPEMSGFPCS